MCLHPRRFPLMSGRFPGKSRLRRSRNQCSLGMIGKHTSGVQVPEKAAEREHGDQIASDRVQAAEDSVKSSTPKSSLGNKRNPSRFKWELSGLSESARVASDRLRHSGRLPYNHVFANLGPLAKVHCLYLGAHPDRNRFLVESRQDQMRNFGRCLLGGGSAAVYYTTYAAYHARDGCAFCGPRHGNLPSDCMVWVYGLLCERRKNRNDGHFFDFTGVLRSSNRFDFLV